MPIAVAHTKYMRVGPRKARLAGALIRGKPVMEALFQLSHSQLKAGKMIKKTLVSALANAENNHDAKREDLYVSEIRIDQGAFYKRAWPRSKGRRFPILRKTSHFFIALDSIANMKKRK